jgi:hypothetical protein
MADLTDFNLPRQELQDFQFALDLGQAIFLFRVVKDTPEGRSGGI